MVATTLHSDSGSLLCPLHYILARGSHTPGVPQCVHTQPPPPGVGQDHLPMALAAQRRSNTAIDVDCARVEALVTHVQVTAVDVM